MPRTAQLFVKVSRFCEKAVLLCRDTDHKLKTSYDTEERLLELLLLQLAEEARHD